MKWYQAIGTGLALMGVLYGCNGNNQKAKKSIRVYQSWVELDNNPNTAERALYILHDRSCTRIQTSQDGKEVFYKLRGCPGVEGNEVKFNDLEASVRGTIMKNITNSKHWKK